MDVGLPETTVSICREARKKDRTVQRRSRIDEATEGTWLRNTGAGLTADLSRYQSSDGVRNGYASLRS